MVATFRDAPRFLTALADMAEEELRLVIIPLSDLDRAQLMTRLVADSDMVFGVWPDVDEPERFGVQVIKGEGMMPPLEGFELPEEVTVAAIPCVGLEQALAARDAWGRAGEEEVEAPNSSRVALAVAEVARLLWIVGRRPDDGDYSPPPLSA
jgi:hypothetical protein